MSRDGRPRLPDDILGERVDLDAVRSGAAGQVGRHHGKLSRSVFSGPTAALLRERIISGAIAPGTLLAESRLAEELSVSRGPIRNALQVLEGEGLVQTQPNGRVRVIGFSEKDVADLLDIRYVLEMAAAERALARSTDFGGLEDALAVMAAEGASTPRLVDLDVAFHLALLEASGSRFLTHAWLSSASVIHASITITNQRLTARENSNGFVRMLEKHHAILDSMVAGDLDRVAVTLHEHFGLAGSLFPAPPTSVG